MVGRAKRNDGTVPAGLLGVGFTRFSPVAYFPCLVAVTGAFPTCCLRLLATSVWEHWRGRSNELPLRLIFVLNLLVHKTKFCVILAEMVRLVEGTGVGALLKRGGVLTVRHQLFFERGAWIKQRLLQPRRLCNGCLSLPLPSWSHTNRRKFLLSDGLNETRR